LPLGIDLGAVSANATFQAELSATLTVTSRTIGAVHTVVYGTLHADDVAPLLTAVVTGRTTIYALSALLAPLLHNKIALVTVWAVGAFVRGAFFTKAQTVNTGAFYIHVHAIGAKHTFLAPVLHFKIALTAAGAMGIFVRGAFFTKAQTVNTGAFYIHVHAIGAKHTFLAPVLDFKIALVAAGTVGAFVRGAFFTKNRPVSGGAFFVNDDAIGAHTALLAPLLHRPWFSSSRWGRTHSPPCFCILVFQSDSFAPLLPRIRERLATLGAWLCRLLDLRAAAFAELCFSFKGGTLHTFQDVNIVHSKADPFAAFATLIEVTSAFRLPGRLQGFFLRIPVIDFLRGAYMSAGQITVKHESVAATIRKHLVRCRLPFGHNFAPFFSVNSMIKEIYNIFYKGCRVLTQSKFYDIK